MARTAANMDHTVKETVRDHFGISHLIGWFCILLTLIGWFLILCSWSNFQFLSKSSKQLNLSLRKKALKSSSKYFFVHKYLLQRVSEYRSKSYAFLNVFSSGKMQFSRLLQKVEKKKKRKKERIKKSPTHYIHKLYSSPTRFLASSQRLALPIFILTHIPEFASGKRVLFPSTIG